MNVFETLKRAARGAAAAAVRPLLARLAPGLPPLRADEWRKCHYSFSQLGEDRVIWALLHQLPPQRSKGIYVDVGAFDPVTFSNTLLLHLAGWRGCNIDANPAAIARFQTARPHDANIVAAVSDCVRQANYLEYPARTTNRVVDGSPGAKSAIGESPTGRLTVVTRTLDDILSSLDPVPDAIDLLSIDCEGEDVRVLAGCDFGRWRPLVVAIEAHDNADRAAIERILRPQGYAPVARTIVTLIFARPPLVLDGWVSAETQLAGTASG
jgi:FkbM family methyltransferase